MDATDIEEVTPLTPTPADEDREDRFEQHIMDDPLYRLRVRMYVAAEPDTPIGEVLDMLAERGQGTALILHEGKLAGIVGERDILLKLAHRDDDWRSQPAAHHMVREPVTLPPTASIAYALNRMSIGDHRHIPIVDEFGHAVGIVSVKDIVAYLNRWIEVEKAGLGRAPA